MSGLTTSMRLRPEHAPRSGDVDELVSVVIPCFNYAQYLPSAIGSVLGQEGVRTEVIVVDDASVDASLSTAIDLAEADDRVRVIAHRTNAGPVQTFNDGVAAASGQYVVRLDADDLLTPGSTARALAVFRAFPSVGLVYGHPLHFSGATPPPHRNYARSWKVWPGHEWLALRCTKPVNVITAPEAIMRKSALEAAGPWQRELRHTHDFELWLRLAAVSDVGYVEGADQAWHRVHSESLSSGIDAVEDLRERWAAFDAFFETLSQADSSSLPGALLPGTRRLRTHAMAGLAREAVALACREYDRGRGSSREASAFRELAAELAYDPECIKGWRGLERRAKGGAAASPLFSVWPRATRRARATVREITWRHRGVF